MSTTTTTQERQTLKTQAEAYREALIYIDKRRTGEIRSLVTPWKKYNEYHIDGIEWGKIVTIAGMSSSGKSAIINQGSNELHSLNPREDFIILIFNYDMTSTEVIIRNTISSLNINNRKLLSADGIPLDNTSMTRVTSFLDEGSANPHVYYCEYPQTVERYKTICKKLYERENKKILIMSDHSILFKKGADDNDTTAMLYALGDASIHLKKEIPCTQMHLSQLNREIEKPDRRIKWSALNYPTKIDMFGGDALYQCADTVLINHRPFLLNFPVGGYGPDKLPTGPDDIYWHFLKCRGGVTGMADMVADFSRFTIKDKPPMEINQ